MTKKSKRVKNTVADQIKRKERHLFLVFIFMYVCLHACNSIFWIPGNTALNEAFNLNAVSLLKVRNKSWQENDQRSTMNPLQNADKAIWCWFGAGSCSNTVTF